MNRLVDLLANTFPFLNNDITRSKWVESKLKSVSDGQSIIDVGAGECKYRIFCSHLKYTNQDNCEYDPEDATTVLHPSGWDTSQIDIVSDITDIPVKNQSYDNVLCTEVLEHLLYPKQAIKEIARILKLNGKLILTAPFCSITHFAPFHYCTGFNIWYKKVLSDNHLKIKSLQRNGNYYDYLCQELLRTPLILRRYTFLGVFGYLLYPLVVPFVALFFIFSKLDKGSEDLLCFGIHIVAQKRTK